MKISILTPTYNRAHTLPNLYNSLIENKKHHKDFEWLIMDDGSTDNTELLIKEWTKEKQINIKYYKQENQGKMQALNNLLQYIDSDITIECDSDDYFTDDAFKIILDKFNEISDNNKIYGIGLLKKDKSSNLIGSSFPKEGMVSKLFYLYNKFNISGDIFLVFKSDIRKQYKHKLENNEKFITEARMYNEIDLKYEGIKVFNIPVLVCEYLPNGYSKNIIDIFKNNPYGYYKYYLEMFNFNLNKILFKKRLHIIKHYILFSYLTNKKKIYTIKQVKGFVNKLLVLVLVIQGYILTKKKFN